MNADRERGERGGSVVPTAISRNFSSMSKFLTMERRARELKSICVSLCGCKQISVFCT
jgi:hypothetical protein